MHHESAGDWQSAVHMTDRAGEPDAIPIVHALSTSMMSIDQLDIDG
jgi:hypothetical protein